MNIEQTIKKHFGDKANALSGMVLIGNKKTGKSLENRGGCPLMQRKDNSFSAPACPSCYAVSVFNNYPFVRNMVHDYNHTITEIIERAAGYSQASKLSGSSIMPGDRLRVYSVTDFAPSNMDALRLLSKVYKLDIISKTLWHFKPCRQHLIELASLKNINISLSFNRNEKLAKIGGFNTIDESLFACRKFIRDNDLQKTVSLNYTFLSDYQKTGRSTIEEYHKIPGVRVYHTVAKDKGALEAVVGRGACGIFDDTGRKIERYGEGVKGSCLACNFCRKGVVA